MADGSFPTLVSKDTTANGAANPIIVQLSDGTNLLDTANGGVEVVVNNTVTVSGSVTVSGTVTADTNFDYAEDSAHSSADVGAFVLAVRNDAGTALAADGDYIPLMVDANGALYTNTTVNIAYDYVDDAAFTVATDTVAAVGMLADESTPDSVNEGDIGIPRMTLDRKQIMVIADATTDSQRLAIDSNGRITVNQAATVNVDIQDSWAGLTGAGTEAGVLRVTIANDSTGLLSVDDNGASLTVDANDLDIRSLNLTDDAVKVSANSTANSITNPIYVHNVKAAVTSTEVHDYGTSTGTGNNDYTVVGTTFLLTSVIFAASGGMKAEVQTGPLASLATKAVGFIPHQGGMNQMFFDPPIEVPVTSTGTVRVVMTNREGSSMDVYSTIIGNDIP